MSDDPQGEAQEKPPGFMDRVREWIRRRPIWSVVIASVVFLIVGVAIGASDTQDETSGDSDKGQVSELEGEVSDLEDQLASAEGGRDEAREQVGALEEQVNETQRRLDRQKEKQAEPEPAATDGGSGGGGGGTTVGDFTFSDVQVSEDTVLGEIDVRARVTNNGGAVEFADLEVTVFNAGSVVAVLEALEPFEAGQTRTVTFIGSDDFGPWDDVEFTVDIP